jgi:hypothetical protein
MDKSSLEALIKWLEVWSAIFGVIVLIGIAGESFFGISLLWNNRKLQRVQVAENKGLRAEISDQSAAHQLDIEKAYARVAEANQKAEHERLARLQIERKLAPRSLNPHQRDALIEQLKLVAPHAKAEICSYGETPEVAGITTQLWRLLGDAGWKVTLSPSLRHGRAPLGIVVESDINDPIAGSIAEGLTQALRTTGGLLVTHELMHGRGQFGEPIRVNVGVQRF